MTWAKHQTDQGKTRLRVGINEVLLKMLRVRLGEFGGQPIVVCQQGAQKRAGLFEQRVFGGRPIDQLGHVGQKPVQSKAMGGVFCVHPRFNFQRPGHCFTLDRF